MYRFNIYANDQFHCTIQAQSAIQAIKYAERQEDMYEQHVTLGKPVEVLAVQHNDSDNWSSSVYTHRSACKRPARMVDGDSIIRGFVYLAAHNGFYRQCLAMKYGNKIAYFDGADLITASMTDIGFEVDDRGLQTWIRTFPNHKEFIYSAAIFEILEAALRQISLEAVHV